MSAPMVTFRDVVRAVSVVCIHDVRLRNLAEEQAGELDAHVGNLARAIERQRESLERATGYARHRNYAQVACETGGNNDPHYWAARCEELQKSVVLIFDAAFPTKLESVHFNARKATIFLLQRVMEAQGADTVQKQMDVAELVFEWCANHNARLECEALDRAFKKQDDAGRPTPKKRGWR